MKTLRMRGGLILIALVLGTACVLASPNSLADGFRIPLPPLPGINIPLPPPPPMVWMPHLNVYVAHDTQRPIFFREGRYYVRDHDRWLASRDYNGPWVQIDSDRLPRSLRVYREEDWNHYEHDADRRYRERDAYAPVPFYPVHNEYRRDDRDEYRHDDRRDDRGDYRRDDRRGDDRRHDREDDR